MGKGDKRTKRGKIIAASYGKSRAKTKKAPVAPAKGKKVLPKKPAAAKK